MIRKTNKTKNKQKQTVNVILLRPNTKAAKYDTYDEVVVLKRRYRGIFL